MTTSLNNRIWTRIILLIVFAAALSLMGCGPHYVRKEPRNLDWPAPPEQPRIHYVQSIYVEDDIGRVYSIMENLFGKTYDDFLARPYSVYARNDRLYVADLMLKRAFIFDFNAHRMTIVNSKGFVTAPSAIVADSDGTIYITDIANTKVAVFDSSGTYRTSYPLDANRPVALGIDDTRKRLYVVDRNNHSVQVFSLDGMKLFDLGSPGGQDGELHYPIAIAIDKQGRMYVLDGGNFRVQVFDSEGKYLTKFGSVGDKVGSFANPKGIAVDSEGHIYVSDAAFSNVQIFDLDGNTLLALGMLGHEPGKFYLPCGLAIDEKNRIYVADQLNKRVQVFQYLSDTSKNDNSSAK